MVPTIVGMTTTIRLRGAADIITVLPYHLGYRPADSLVVVCLTRQPDRDGGRIDLPPPDVDPGLVTVELLPVVSRERPDAVVLVAFESEPGRSEPASLAMRDAIRSTGVPVVDRLLVREDWWWALDCDGDCCPAEGRPVPADDEVPAVADYILRGATRRGREPTSWRGWPTWPTPRRRRAARPSSTIWRRRVARARPSCGGAGGCCGTGAASSTPPPEGPDSVTDPPGRDDEAWAWAVVSLLDVAVRDLLIAWLCPGTLDLEVFPASLRRMAEAELPPRSVLRRDGPRATTPFWTSATTRVPTRAPTRVPTTVRSRRVSSSGWRWSAARHRPSCRPGR